jgi:hypothetical protein
MSLFITFLFILSIFYCFRDKQNFPYLKFLALLMSYHCNTRT